MMTAVDRAFGRYVVRSPLGEGALGVVYEAYDPDSGTTVALKTIRAPDPEFAFQLKHEFRTLTNLYHPNFIRYGELVCNQEQWFFTMELIRGSTFLDYVLEPIDPANPEIRRFNEVRLRDSLAQLIDAVSTLHASGHVHRDIKPKNVLVTEEGRVVLLDFGLAWAYRKSTLSDHGMSGTPAYMAPEQVEGATIGPEADWYAVGVMLFQALTGQLPFAGSDLSILEAKFCEPPPLPRDFAENLPADLDELCHALLQVEPEKRPTSDVLRAEFGVLRQSFQPAVTESGTGPFVGREQELAQLRDAFEEVARGAQRTVVVTGEPGVGKSALIERFLDSLPSTSVLLRGRCYEEERVPFGGVDSLVDALTDHLLTLDDQEAGSLLSGGIRSLATVFPVLNRVPIVSKDAQNIRAVPNESALRTQAVGELARVVSALTKRAPLIIYLDDLQWITRESAALLQDIFESSDAACLFLTTMRSNVTSTVSPSNLFPRHTQISLSGLDEREALLLWDQLAGTPGTSQQHLEARDLAVREAGGHPLFLTELMRAARAGRLSEQSGSNLQQVIWNRIAQHDEVERKFLEVTAIAGTPTPYQVLARAASLDVSECLTRLGGLKAAQLVRVTRDGENRNVEPYHDRIREAVRAQLGNDQATVTQLHYRLGQALLEATPPEEVPSHIFSIVQHLNAASDLVTNRAERLRLAELNSIASREARLATAYERASEHARIGLRLLGEGAWHQSYALARDLHVSWMKAEHLAGHYKQALRVFDTIGDRLSAQDDKAHLCVEWIELETGAGHHREAIESGRAMLAELGSPLPATATSLDVLRDYLAVRLVQGLRTAESLRSLPEMQDPRQRSIVRILVAISPAVYFLDANLIACILMRVAKISIQAGVSDLSWYGFAGYGLVLTGALNKHREAEAFGRLALELNQRFRKTKHAHSDDVTQTRMARVLFQVASFLSSWVKPYEEVKKELRNARQVAAEFGDTLYEAYPAGVLSLVSFCEGRDLTEQNEAAKWAIEISRHRQSADMAAVAEAHLRYGMVLCGRKPTTELDWAESSDRDFLASLSEESTPSAMFHYYFCRADLAQLFDRDKLAEELLAESLKHNQVNFALPTTVELCFLDALLAAKRFDSSRPLERLRLTLQVTHSCQKLERWSRSCPANFEAQALLIRAELLRISELHKQAASTYERAVASARRHGSKKRVALALERAALHARETGGNSAQLLNDAKRAYLEWGAAAKAQLL